MSIENSQERLHHPWSASKTQYLEASPMFVNEQSKNTAASEAGTLQHDSAELPINIDDPRLEDHQFEAVQKCRAYRDQVIAAAGPGAKVLKEVYVSIDDQEMLDAKGNKFPGTTGGYLDLAVLNADETELDIIDYKFGLWSVEPAENNTQGMTYLLGIVREHPTVKKARVHFLLPHRDEIDVHEFTSDQFPAMLLRLKTIVSRAITLQAAGDTSKCTPYVSTCLFCARKGTCEALASFALKVGKKYAPLKVPDQVTPTLLLDPTHGTEAMEISTLLEAWAKAVRKQVTDRSLEEEEWLPDGYVLRARQATEIIDWPKFAMEARKRGVDGKTIRESLKIRVEPTYKYIRSLAPRGKKDEAEEAFRNEMLEKGIAEKAEAVHFLERIKS